MSTILTVYTVTSAFLSFNLTITAVAPLSDEQQCKDYLEAQRTANDSVPLYKDVKWNDERTKLGMFNESTFALPGRNIGVIFTCEKFGSPE